MDLSKLTNSKAIKEKSDLVFKYAIIGHFLFGVFLAFFYNTWLIGVGVGGLCVVLYFASKILLPEYSLYQYLGSTIMSVFMAQFIYQMHGMFEMHFFAFLGAALLITYQNWRLFIPSTLFIVIHHAGFAYLQFSGMQDIYFTQMQYMDLTTFLFHVGLAAVIIGICGYWAFDLSVRSNNDKTNQTSLLKQLENIQQGVNFATEISNGNLDYQINEQEADSELSKALLSMRVNLKEAALREKQERYIDQGSSNINEILRTKSNNLDELSNALLKELVTYTGINQAGLFITTTEEERTYLKLSACYAYDRRKFITKEIEIGEGLVGQAYLEKDIIYMNDVPQGYTFITSGLGEATAGCIIVMPLIDDETVVGVLELASLSDLDEIKRRYIEKISQSIASTLKGVEVNQQTKVLLESLQEQTEEMRAQEEEMRQNMEELSATQEEMQRNTERYKHMLEVKDDEIIQLQEQLKKLQQETAKVSA